VRVGFRSIVSRSTRFNGWTAMTLLLSGALHGRAWLTEASQFLSTHADELVVRPKWLYSVGMPGALARPLRRLAMREVSAGRRGS
jgi:menaquinone-dependent protoporphyrinogen oxidase